MNDLIPLRCSSLPLAAACMASQFHDGPITDTAGPEARLGSAVHECLVLSFDGAFPDTEAMAKKWGVDPREVGQLYHQAMRCWDQMEESFCAC